MYNACLFISFAYLGPPRAPLCSGGPPLPLPGGGGRGAPAGAKWPCPPAAGGGGLGAPPPNPP